MKFAPFPLTGAFVIDLDLIEDDRGFFARTFCMDEFRAHGLDPVITQCNLSHNRTMGTLRGLHYQIAPYQETKVVRCVRGAIFDVALDLRPHSDTYLRWSAVELTAGNRRALYVPKGVAHGFQTLEDETDVYYDMSEQFVSEAGRGVRWNDPAFGIQWPLANPILAPRDAAYPDFREVAD